jgi:hypothetical protein
MPGMKRRGRLRWRYGYVLAAVLALGLLGGTIAVIKSGGRVPEDNATTTVRTP